MKEIGAFTRVGLSRIEIVAIAVALAMVATTSVILTRGDRGEIAAERALCLQRLGEIGKALGAYMQSSDDRWPYVAKLPSAERHAPPWPGLAAVLAPYVTDRAIFRCPADRRTLSPDSVLAGRFPRESTYFATEGTSYEWLFGETYGGKKRGDDSLSKASGFGLGPPDQPVLRDFELFHAGDGGGAYNTLFADLRARTGKATGQRF